jgi:hypothetical protein
MLRFPQVGDPTPSIRHLLWEALITFRPTILMLLRILVKHSLTPRLKSGDCVASLFIAEIFVVHETFLSLTKTFLPLYAHVPTTQGSFYLIISELGKKSVNGNGNGVTLVTPFRPMPYGGSSLLFTSIPIPSPILSSSRCFSQTNRFRRS